MEFDKNEIRKKALAEHKRMSKLFKENRFMFGLERKKKIEKLIKSASPEYRERLRKTQARWDKNNEGSRKQGESSCYGRTTVNEPIYQCAQTCHGRIKIVIR